MATALAERAMARIKGRPKSDRDDATAKIDRGVLAKARYVSDARGVTLAEYLTEALRPIIDRDFADQSKPKPKGKP